jgi:chitinase
MIGQNDASDELFSLADAQQLETWAAGTSYCNLLAMWSAGRDNGGCAGQAYASPTCSGISQSAFAYVNVFKALTGTTGGGGGGNTPPTVSLTSPANGATFTAGANITLTASASDSNGTVSQVQFFHNGTLIGSDTTSPYSVVWSAVASGTYSLTAVATDNGGATTTSAAVSITVGGGTTGGTCAGLLVYPAGLGTYQPGQVVVNGGQRYQVKPWPYSGWANQVGAYAPGTGWAWQDAWVLLGPCS